jgi:hypothetical protein
MAAPTSDGEAAGAPEDTDERRTPPESDNSARAAGRSRTPAAGRAGRTRVHHGELTSATGALALLALLFLTKWYGVAGVPDPSAARPAISTAVNGFNGLGLVRWVVVATICAAFGSVALHASQRSHGNRTDTSRVILTLGALTSVLLIYRVLIELPASSKVIDQKLGAFLGLLCALGIALGGWESVREQQTSAGSAVRRSRSESRLASRRRAQ